MEKYTIAPATHIGHANLKVADLESALSFYRDVLGFQVRAIPRGGEMVVLGASGSSLDLALISLRGGSPPSANCTGLDHLALRYPSRRELARAYQHLRECGIALSEAEEGQLPFQHKPLDLAHLLAELDTPEPPRADTTDGP